MTFSSKHLGSLALAAAMASSIAIAGCSSNRYYRAQDPYYHDSHVFNNGEVVYYQQWEGERHLEHREFQTRTPEEQHAYFDWRHSHHDNDRH